MYLQTEFRELFLNIKRFILIRSTSEPAIVAEKSTFDALPPSASASQSIVPLPIHTPFPKSTPFATVTSFQSWITASTPSPLKTIPATILLPTSVSSSTTTPHRQYPEVSRLPTEQYLPCLSSNAVSPTSSLESIIQEDFLVSPPMRSIPSPSLLIPTRQTTHSGMTISCDIHPTAWNTLYVPTAVVLIGLDRERTQ